MVRIYVNDTPPHAATRLRTTRVVQEGALRPPRDPDMTGTGPAAAGRACRDLRRVGQGLAGRWSSLSRPPQPGLGLAGRWSSLSRPTQRGAGTRPPLVEPVHRNRGTWLSSSVGCGRLDRLDERWASPSPRWDLGRRWLRRARSDRLETSAASVGNQPLSQMILDAPPGVDVYPT